MTRFSARGRWLDLLLAAALTVLGQVELWSGLVVGGPRAAVAVLLAVGTMAVAFRRQAPMAVVIVSFGCWSGQALMGVDSDSAFAPILASFLAVGSAAFYARRPVVALIVAILLVWPVILLDKGWAPADLIYAAVLILLAWSVGRGFAVGNLRAQLAEQRTNAALAQERVEIARELHDIVAHSISVMTLHAGGVRRLLRPDQETERDALDVVEQTGRQALAELQRVLGVLRTPADRPLEARPGLATVDELLESARATGLTADLHIEGQPRPLPAGVDLSAYRIMQEALTNVLKHAAASHVVVNIHYDGGTVRLAVIDDGTGRSVNGVQPGHGLIGMRERAALYGGVLEAGPLPGRGFRIAATIPASEAIS